MSMNNVFDLPVIGMADGSASVLGALRRTDRPLVVDFWNERCTRCPEALAKLDHMASEKASLIDFVACALSTSEDASIERVKEVLGENFEHLGHAHMSFDAKERLKTLLSFSTLPFCIVCDRRGEIVWKGDPRSPELVVAIEACEATP